MPTIAPQRGLVTGRQLRPLWCPRRLDTTPISTRPANRPNRPANCRYPHAPPPSTQAWGSVFASSFLPVDTVLTLVLTPQAGSEAHPTLRPFPLLDFWGLDRRFGTPPLQTTPSLDSCLCGPLTGLASDFAFGRPLCLGRAPLGLPARLRRLWGCSTLRAYPYDAGFDGGCPRVIHILTHRLRVFYIVLSL